MDVSQLQSLFRVADPDRAGKKIAAFIENGADKLHLLLDFDRTLTAPSVNNGQDITTWHILKSYLPPEGKQEYEKIYQKYRALELAGTMTLDDATAWWEESLAHYTKYRVNITDVYRSFFDHATIRPGTRELFALCNRLRIPMSIISAGIGDLIDQWLDMYRLHPDVVIATRLTFSDSGEITGHVHDSLVHILNKNAQSHPKLDRITRDRRYAMLIGDGWDDWAMADGDADVLRIRIFDPRKDEQIDLEQYRRKTFEKFDLLIESGTFTPALRLIRTIAGLPEVV